MTRFDCGEVITAMVTPMNTKGEIDYDNVEKLAKHLIENGSDALLVAGTTGESPTLTNDEERELVSTVKRAVSGKAKIILSAGSNCTKTAVNFSKNAQKAEYQKQTTGGDESQLTMLEKLALTQQDFTELKAYCEQVGIGFISTPFDLESIHFLDQLIRMFSTYFYQTKRRKDNPIQINQWYQ